MTESKRYDIAIIGSGPGGYVAAIRAAQLGLSVAVVEKDRVPGGTCLHRGCIPTKALLEHASRYHDLLRAAEFGFDTGPVRVHWDRVQSRKQQVVGQLSKGVSGLLRRGGVDVVTGWGRIVEPGRVGVYDKESYGRTGLGKGPVDVLHADNVIVATGSVPREISMIPFDGERILSSDHILGLTRIPESLIVVGAGAVGVEFASIFRRFGCDVLLVEALPRILPIEDEDVSDELARSFDRQGIEVRTAAPLRGASLATDGVELTFEDGSPARRAEAALIAIGRTPVTEGIGLENTAIELDGGYIAVDEFCATAEPGVYAIGDVVPTPWLAHVASMEGIMVVERIAGRDVHPVPYGETPNCTYCEPEVASVGLTERAARDAGHQVRIGRFPFLASGRAQIAGHTEGFVKIVADERYDEILGVHIIGYKATELIAEAGAVLRLEGTVEELIHTIHAHPTLAESIHEAAHAVYEGAIHF